MSQQSDNTLMTQALVVICPDRPDHIANQPVLGHVGWGYEYPDKTWCIGAIEGPDWQGSFNGFWARHAPDLRSALMYFADMGAKLDAQYDFYKLLTVSNGITADHRAADRVVAWVREQEYNLIDRNCMDSTYDVLRAFANCAYNDEKLPSPDSNWIPNGWFDEIKTDEYYRLPARRQTVAKQEQHFDFELRLEEHPLAPAWRVGETLPSEQPQLQWLKFIEPTAKSPIE